jgi:hypothetical protein
MPRDRRSKPSNVVKSRSAPSLLGGFSPSGNREELPSNRFIELGDIALGNARRHAPYGKVEVPEPETVEAEPSEPVVDLPVELPVLKGIQKPPKPPKMSLPIQRPPKPPKLVAAPRRKTSASAPLTRPKPPKPPSARPNVSLPPKSALPKPPKVNRPKPFTGRLQKSNHSRPLK